MTRFIILVLLLTLLAACVTGDHHQFKNPVHRDLLESITKSTINHLNIIGDLSDRDIQSQWLWQIYNLSSRSDTEILGEALTYKANVEGQINTAAFLLFGPVGVEATLRAVRAPESVADDFQCVESTVQLFQKYCSPLLGNGFMYRRALANMCHYVVDKAAIEAAFMAVCAVPKSKLFDIDLRSPLLDRVSPTPGSGSSEYCERVSTSVVSRMRFGKFAEVFRVFMVPYQQWKWFEKLQICVHGDSSLGLCDCKQDDWRFMGKSWSFLMSPYEERFIDIMFSDKISGSLLISVEEVLQPWRYVSLVVGFATLFLAQAIEKYMLSMCIDEESAHSVKWIMRVIGVAFIFHSSIDTAYASAAVVFCLAISHVITIIMTHQKLKELYFWHWSGQYMPKFKGSGLQG